VRGLGKRDRKFLRILHRDLGSITLEKNSGGFSNSFQEFLCGSRGEEGTGRFRGDAISK
jgi:hypothetical protein